VPKKPNPDNPELQRSEFNAPGFYQRSVTVWGRAYMVPDPHLTPAHRRRLDKLLRPFMRDASRLDVEVPLYDPPTSLRARVMYEHGPDGRPVYRDIEVEPGPPPPSLPEPLLAVASVVADLRAMRDNRIDEANPWRDVPPKVERLARACDEVLYALADLERDPYAPSAIALHRQADSHSGVAALKRGALFVGVQAKTRLKEWASIRRPAHRRKAVSAHEAVRELAAIWERETTRRATFSNKIAGGGPFVEFVRGALAGSGNRKSALALVRAFTTQRKRGAKK
jgi:hypothetical protein